MEPLDGFEPTTCSLRIKNFQAGSRNWGGMIGSCLKSCPVSLHHLVTPIHKKNGNQEQEQDGNGQLFPVRSVSLLLAAQGMAATWACAGMMGYPQPTGGAGIGGGGGFFHFVGWGVVGVCRRRGHDKQG